MTLLITFIAAVIVTLVWYTNERARKLNISLLCFTYWGASLMWLVDAVAGYIEDGADYFVPSYQEMINDGFLGFSAVAFGMLIWLVSILIKDPYGIVKSVLVKSK